MQLDFKLPSCTQRLHTQAPCEAGNDTSYTWNKLTSCDGVRVYALLGHSQFVMGVSDVIMNKIQTLKVKRQSLLWPGASQ